jgi:hypothetical protein
MIHLKFNGDFKSYINFRKIKKEDIKMVPSITLYFLLYKNILINTTLTLFDKILLTFQNFVKEEL